jgi:hypothetical protein
VNRLGAPRIGTLLDQAATAPQLWLPRVDPHPAGPLLGLGGFGLGVWAVSGGEAVAPALAWTALGAILVGMLLNGAFKRLRRGWRVDFAARRVEPVLEPGRAVDLSGEPFSIAVAPGEKRRSMAVDLRHDDLGRVVRLFDSDGWRDVDARQMDTLADLIARRLALPRSGPRLAAGKD